ncbi:MAG TPA: carboxypeptidase-like regulatory domain-containing protein [Planctomycetota bacterium]|nr:carboxypeptidase-like regulatory domain-containing protein [Planctomycetota bacterium]
MSSSDVAATKRATDTAVETRVYGSVLDRAGHTIQGTWWSLVLFVDAAGKRQHVDTTEKGTYEFRGLGFGSYWVTVRADGYRTLEEQFELRAEAPVVQKDFVLADGNEVRVRVLTPEGGSLWDAMDRARAPDAVRGIVPVATREPPGKRIEGVMAHLGNNKYGVGNLWNYGPRAKLLGRDFLGLLVLDCERPLYVSLMQFQSVLRTERVEEGQEEVTFIVSLQELLANLADVRLRVVSADDDRPVRGVRLALGDGFEQQSTSSTDVQGSAEFKGLAPGSYELTFAADGFENLTQRFDAPSAGRIDLGTIALGRELRLTGRALDDGGAPHPVKFAVGACFPEEHRIDWIREERAACKPDGSFEIQGLGRRRYALRTKNYDEPNAANSPETWVSRVVTIDLRDGPIAELEVRLERASKLLLSQPSASAQGLKFRIVDGRGFEIARSTFYELQPRRLMLPPDQYRVSIFDPTGGFVVEKSVTLGSETLLLDLAH